MGELGIVSQAQWSDMLGDFMALADGIISPDMFKRWACIGLIAGAMERRVWVRTYHGVVYPSMYLLLVGPPGTGKYIVTTVRDLWRETMIPNSTRNAFHVAPNNMTKASLIDCIAESKTTELMTETGPPVEYSTLLVGSEEFSVLMPEYANDYVGTLNDIWNCPPQFSEKRRYGEHKDVNITNPQLHMLAGTQPAWLGALMPEEAWNSGISRRLFMIYASEAPMTDPFGAELDRSAIRKVMLDKLAAISRLYGQARWTQDAADYYQKWYLTTEKGSSDGPTHSKLQYYRGSRPIMVQKLALTSAVCRTGDLQIDAVDMRRAMEWMLDAEKWMPEIFHAMSGKSDVQVLEQLHYFATALYARAKDGAKFVHSSSLVRFLTGKIPSDRIMLIIQTAERANMIERVSGEDQQWVPIPRHKWHIE